VGNANNCLQKVKSSTKNLTSSRISLVVETVHRSSHVCVCVCVCVWTCIFSYSSGRPKRSDRFVFKCLPHLSRFGSLFFEISTKNLFLKRDFACFLNVPCAVALALSAQRLQGKGNFFLSSSFYATQRWYE